MTDWLRRRQVAVYAVAVSLAIGVGAARPGSAAVIERFIDPVLAALLYATFLEIPFVRLRRAATNGRFLAAALGMNVLVVPVVAWDSRGFCPGTGDSRGRVHGAADAVYRLRDQLRRTRGWRAISGGESVIEVPHSFHSRAAR